MENTRYLQEDEVVPGTDAKVMKNTFTLYGSLLIIIFAVFCWVRKRFPKPYTLRQWVDSLKTDIAEDQHGFISWMWQLNTVVEDEILSECGLDALCYLRLIRMGFKIACVSCFNAFWLMPLYARAPHDSTSSDSDTNSTSTNSTGVSTDRVTRLTTANVQDGSLRFIGTVVAAYILFFYVMYLVLKEFEWFIEKRHKKLRAPQPENYSVYVRNIPKEFRSNNRLETYFQYCLGGDRNVVETRLRVKAPALQKAVQKRDDYVAKLEHALNYERIKSESPTHREMNLRTGKFQVVESIPFYSQKLREANADVQKRIEEIEGMITTPRAPDSESPGQGLGSGSWYDDHVEFDEQAQPLTSGLSHESGSSDDADVRETALPVDEADEKPGGFFAMKLLSSAATKATKEVANVATTATKMGTNIAATGVKAGVSGVANVASAATNLLNTNEGEYYSAGFVTFRTLGTKNAAIQMVHYDKPFQIEVTEAPRPDDVFWSNVGREHSDLQIGKLLSLGATVALCFFWTIPMTFIAALSSVESLTEEFEFFQDMIEKAPFMEDVLTVLAPLFVKIANALLPIILERLTMLEGPVSSSIVEASLFTKLAAFMIIQTFFVSAIGSGIMDELSALIEDPTSAISLLAESLPKQSTYFAQIVFVGTVVTLGMEMLRVIPLILALVRRCVGPKLTEKERQTTFMGIRPLADPTEFEHADNLSNLVFNFIVMLVYAVIAPLTAFIQGFCFLLMHVCYRHQFVFIYSKNPDSGGKIWSNFVKVLLSCLLIAEFTISGLMALKKAAVPVILMTPLIVITVLFNAYIHQEHFRVAEFLPSRDCMKVDLNNGPDFDLPFTKDVYLQNELQVKTRLPENLEEERAQTLKLDELSTVELTNPADTSELDTMELN